MKRIKIFTITVFVLVAMVPAICLAQLDSTWWANGGDSYVNYDNSIIVTPNIPEADNSYDVSWGKDNVGANNNSFILKFNASESVKLRVRIYKNSSPWTEYGTSGVMTVIPGMNELTINCQSGEPGENAVLVVELGFVENIGKSLSFSKVSFELIGVTTTTTTIPITTTTTTIPTTTTTIPESTTTTTTTLPETTTTTTTTSITTTTTTTVPVLSSPEKLYLSGAAGDGLVVLNFQSPTATSYDIFQKAGEDWELVVMLEGVTGYIAQGLDNGTAYLFKVVALNLAGSGAEQEIELTPQKNKVQPPANLAYTETDGKIFLSWDASSGIVEGYKILLDGELIETTSELSCLFDVNPGKIVVVSVSAYVSQLDGVDKESEQLSIKVAVSDPLNPENLKAEITDGYLEITFAGLKEGLDYYLLQINENEPINIGQLQEKVFILPEGWTGPYQVKVWAVYEDGNQSAGVMALATINTITDLFALYNGEDLLEIRWQAVNEEVKLLIDEQEYQSTDQPSFVQLPVQADSHVVINSSLNGVSGVSISITLGNSPYVFWKLSKGWHLISCPVQGEIFTALQKQGIKSIWSWKDSNWAVYLPSQDTQTYVQVKGFGVLNSLESNQGFWLNLEEMTSVFVAGWFPLFQESPGSGWNLIGGGKETVFNSQLGEFDSIWVWRNENWSVYLPDDDTQTYTQAKGFTVLEEIYPGEGFWVNKQI